MGYYYFVQSSLPPLILKQKPPISTEELRELLELNLNDKDKEQVRLLRGFIDLENVRAIWLNQPLDPNGNLDEKELDEALLSEQDLPDYIFDFLSQFESLEDRLKNFSYLWVHFFLDAERHLKGFLKDYFKFERESRLVLTALRSKHAKKDLAKELQFEDPTDTFVAFLLAQKDMESYEPEVEYLPLKNLFIENISDPKALYLALLGYRFSKVEQMMEYDPFDIDHVLGYYIRLIFLEKLYKLDEEKGRQILDAMIQNHQEPNDRERTEK